MLNNISEKDLRKTHKIRVINFPGVIREKITDQVDDVIKAKPDDLIIHVGTIMILQTMLIIWTM